MRKKIDKFIEPIFDEFLEDRKNSVVQLKAAIEKEDYSTIRDIGHQMAGNSANFGLREMESMGANLEKHAVDKNLGGIKTLYKIISKYLDELEVYFD